MTTLKDTEFNRNTGVLETTALEDGKLVNHLQADITSLIEKNQQAYNSGNNGFTKERNMRQLAELDMVTVQRLLVEHGIDVFSPDPDHMKRLKKWLKDPANKHFRTAHGQF